ncbi:hypothetical protein CC1G_06694 [Coprinopsis cinerea okayama7|uniref:Pre-rRNA-processing protein TSR2 n=1 Tax=Coprinopsis cinerea (strain Okayama-7 / 130 / ATCC MYA-4618 / FGSC 9003) TaxID=240176 RepID=A8P819_COPC7|nr:hypothetical protein CC1G_06694 [Coprinopsis cinerea okayama7\|eukprot:XP_001839481.1 hypothetical protein CC1G_06694 [Coprinopsis cinerea okayama7\
MASTSQPPATSVLFARGVIARLAIWPTLKIAVQESWGGPESAQKRSWMASVVVDTFETTTPPPDDQYIEELLLQIMSDEFEVSIEDGSGESVARDLVQLWDETREGRDAGVLKFEELAEKSKGKKVEYVAKDQSDDEDWESDDGEDDGDEEMDEDVPQLLQPSEPRPKEEPEVDEDGFTLVKSKKGRR